MKSNLWRTLPLVLLAGLLLVVFAIPALAQNNPVPLINQPLVPDAVAPGDPAFTLTVNGTGFVATSVVNWNGSPRTTTFVSGSRLTAAITAADIAAVGSASVTVVNPAPGGGTSNVAFLSIAGSSSTVSFRLASSANTGGSFPTLVAVGDFNGDGNLDLAVSNEPSETVSIFLGDGRGNLTLASSLATGVLPGEIAVGDFNADGNLDLAVVIGAADTVSIFLGDGAGNFTLASSPLTGYEPISVAVGDFNGDGKLDLAVANSGGNTASILLGDGTGNFTLASSPAVCCEPLSLAAGDFNGDGNLDIAVTTGSSNAVSILLGNGAGGFTLGSSTAAGDFPYSVAVGDFNGDGKLDLAIADKMGNTATILLGDGSGNFSLASTLATGVTPYTLALGDFNGDGKLDVAVVNFCGNDPHCNSAGTVSVLLGDGTGNFSLGASPPTGIQPYGIAVGDFNGDGKLDIAVSNSDKNTVSILLQGTAVTLAPASLDFGNRTVGTTSTAQSATLTNVGYTALNIASITLGGKDPGDFSEVNTCPKSLPVGVSCTISAKFRPVTGATRSAVVSITDDGGNNPQMISLTGVGLSVNLSTNNLNFGDVMVGKISQPQIVVLTNIGSTTLTIKSITVSGTDNGDFSASNTCHGSVAPGGTCNIIVRFIPTLTGLRTAVVNVTDNGGGSPQKISLSGTGT